MYKKLLFFIAFLPLTTLAQWMPSPNQTMVRHSIRPALYVVASGYKLQDSTGQLFGRHSRPDFSHGYTLAVSTDSGVVLSRNALRPWQRDADMERYSGSHVPVLSTLSYRTLADTGYTSLPASITDSTATQVVSLDADAFNGAQPLDIYADDLSAHSWLLWAYVSDTLGKARSTYTTAIIHNATAADSTGVVHVIPPTLPYGLRDSVAQYKPIGAVLIVPTYPQAGIVRFCVAGMVMADSIGWMLIPLQQLSSPATNVGIDELTPSPQMEPAVRGNISTQKQKKKRR